MKIDMTKVDSNFLKGTSIDRTDVVWLNALDEPLSIHGLAVTKPGKVLRLPEPLVDEVNEGVCILGRHTAGGRIRFRTDSSFLAYRAKLLYTGSMSHMPLTGSAGTDVYAGDRFLTTFRPEDDRCEWYEGLVQLPAGMKDITLSLPLYNGLTEICIGLETGSEVLAPAPYAIEKPVVFYGSSITQGGCASRPSNSYQGFLTRWLNIDHINLGFSGSGRGEQNIAEYIASLDMSAFVLDYDHNAPNAEHLRNTHYRFYDIVRKAHPDLPIIMTSKPDCDNDPCADERRAVIRETYERARAQGDDKVWFVDGRLHFGGNDRGACTMDGCHPNDLGFYRMASAFLPALKESLGL